MKTLAIDLGDARTGIAISDENKFLASPFGMIDKGVYKPYNKTCEMQFDYKSFSKAGSHINMILEIAKKHGVDEIVFGLPLNMDGSESNRAQKTKTFADLLKQDQQERVNNQIDKQTINIKFVDERLTSIEAEEILKSQGKSNDEIKKLGDIVAAVIILQNYLDNSK
jgi:putative Holliday junction resolvase